MPGELDLEQAAFGAEHTFDVSADLLELARTPVAVVCAGAKSILDLPKTLEVLETHGVPLLGYQTDTFPAFYTRSSGEAVTARVDSAEQAAAIIRTRDQLKLAADGGEVIAVPIPETQALAPDVLEHWTAQALAAAEAQGIQGKAVTPFLLRHIADLSEGKTLTANLALVENNARVATEIAVVLAR